MRDELSQDIFGTFIPEPSHEDPVRRAQIQMKRPLPKRFYESVGMEEREDILRTRRLLLERMPAPGAMWAQAALVEGIAEGFLHLLGAGPGRAGRQALPAPGAVAAEVAWFCRIGAEIQLLGRLCGCRRQGLTFGGIRVVALAGCEARQ